MQHPSVASSFDWSEVESILSICRRGFNESSVANLTLSYAPAGASEFWGCKGDARFPNVTSCLVDLQSKGLWPSAASLQLARQRLSSTATLMLGDSTMFNKFRYLVERWQLPGSCNGGKGVCFLSLYKDCSSQMLRKVSSQTFDLVLWNTGVWHMHKPYHPWSYSSTPMAHNKSLEQCAQFLKQRFPAARIVYKATNWICTQNWHGPWQKYVRQGAFTEFANRSGHLTLNSTGSIIVQASEAALAERHQWSLASSYTDSGVCRCSGENDGRHFPFLIPKFIVGLGKTVFGTPLQS